MSLRARFVGLTNWGQTWPWLTTSVLLAAMTVVVYRSRLRYSIGTLKDTRIRHGSSSFVARVLSCASYTDPPIEDDDPGLFKKHSTIETFTTRSGRVYPSIRVFYSTHSQAAKLPKDLPLLVFIHGLGGNATQFSPLLTSLTNVAPCLAIDLPGCGRSAFEPKEPDAYTQHAFAELLCAAIDRFRDVKNNQQVVLVGHSMGCTTAALLASSTSPLAGLLSGSIIGFIAICPRSSSPSPRELKALRRLIWLPASLFDLLRQYDRRGGLTSKSVTRVVGSEADVQTRTLQQRYNAQSKSSVFLRIIASALMPLQKEHGDIINGWPGYAVWSGIRVPLFLISGEADTVTPPEEAELVARWLTEQRRPSANDSQIAPVTDKRDAGQSKRPRSAPFPSSAGDAHVAESQLVEDKSHKQEITVELAGDSVTEVHRVSKHSLVVKTATLPAPAAHGLMYSTPSVRVLSGLIERFLSHYVDERLSLGWQLQHLTTSGKWDVKNLKKWQSIDPCSDPIGDVFRAMKTMREVDDHHCPSEFVKRFSYNALPDGVAMVVDISHESPVYDPKGLEKGGVEYHKFPTVSKLPPTVEEVAHFISLIDQLRDSSRIAALKEEGKRPTIGVHCHYGFNRTGMFIVSYLVERLNYKLQDALDEFAQKRSPGIKHEHFVNELFVRYAVSLKRKSTFVG